MNDMVKVLFWAVLLVGSAQAQRYTSPPRHTTVTIADKKITVNYFAPSMHGRKIMGGLVPYGEVWCTGANIATGLTTEADLEIGGMRLPHGTYTIWTVPGEKEWTLIINMESGQFHLNYNPTLDFGRTKMELKTLPSPQEMFQILLREAGDHKGELSLAWENTVAFIPFTVLP